MNSLQFNLASWTSTSFSHFTTLSFQTNFIVSNFLAIQPRVSIIGAIFSYNRDIFAKMNFNPKSCFSQSLDVNDYTEPLFLISATRIELHILKPYEHQIIRKCLSRQVINDSVFLYHQTVKRSYMHVCNRDLFVFQHIVYTLL